MMGSDVKKRFEAVEGRLDSLKPLLERIQILETENKKRVQVHIGNSLFQGGKSK